MENIINLRLLSHPLNWGIVWITLILVSFGYTVIAHRLKPDQSLGDESN